MSMKMTPQQIAKHIPCQRCGKRKPKDKLLNLTFKDGVVIGVVCGDCQTTEEYVEAEVHLAMIDYSTLHTNPSGQAVAQLKGESR